MDINLHILQSDADLETAEVDGHDQFTGDDDQHFIFRFYLIFRKGSNTLTCLIRPLDGSKSSWLKNVI